MCFCVGLKAAPGKNQKVSDSFSINPRVFIAGSQAKKQGAPGMSQLTKKEKAGDSYICPLFLIPKSKVSKLKNYFEIIRDFFWNLEKKDKTDKFFEIRDSLNRETRDTHFLIFLGEDYDKKLTIPFGNKTIKRSRKIIFKSKPGSYFITIF